MLLNYHIGRFFLGSMCVGDLVRLGLSGVRVAGFSDIKLVFYSLTITMMHGPVNIRWQKYYLHYYSVDKRAATRLRIQTESRK